MQRKADLSCNQGGGVRDVEQGVVHLRIMVMIIVDVMMMTDVINMMMVMVTKVMLNKVLST